MRDPRDSAEERDNEILVLIFHFSPISLRLRLLRKVLHLRSTRLCEVAVSVFVRPLFEMISSEHED